MEYKCRNTTALDNGFYCGWLTVDALKPVSAAIKYKKMANAAGRLCDDVEIEKFGKFNVRGIK